jgi:membrane protease YdiL (CAAX protease family)
MVVNESRTRPAWRDLFLYLVVGVGGYLAASLAVEAIARPTKMTVGLSFLAFSLNVLFLGGSVLVLGVWRGRIDLRSIGFAPPRLNVNLMFTAAVVSLLILPARSIAALAVQAVLGGAFDSTRLRLEMIAPEGFTWLGFALALLGVGILVPISEELFFRGALYSWFRGRYSFRTATLLSAGLFGLAHADTAAVVASSFIFGVAAAFMFERTKSLWVTIVMHMTSNSFAVIFLYAVLAWNPAALG